MTEGDKQAVLSTLREAAAAHTALVEACGRMQEQIHQLQSRVARLEAALTAPDAPPAPEPSENPG